MDTRKISPAVRRRVGQSVNVYAQAFNGVARSMPMGTDWNAIEAAFAAKSGVVSTHVREEP